MRFDRAQRNIFAEWWWTINRPVLVMLLFLAALGCMMVGSAGPAVAQRFSDSDFYFLQRHILFLMMGFGVMGALSFVSERTLRRISIIGLICAVVMVIVVLLFAPSINGAKRWLSIAGFTLQPSEFIKPFFIVVTGWLLSKSRSDKRFRGYAISTGLCALLCGLLMLQPDFGMTFVLLSVWIGQVFLSGISLHWTVVIIGAGALMIVGAYLKLDHVRERIHTFFGEGGYQEAKSIEAFKNGGLLGTGPGEGTVKLHLPDAHTDFIFAVIGEELGALVAAAVALMYLMIIILSARRLMRVNNMFVLLTSSGILLQFGLQAMINMSVAVRLAPTKGMTLPLVSYGGSSMLAICIGLGFLLRLTRRHYGNNVRKRNPLY